MWQHDMEDIFIRDIFISKVRHLEGLYIPLSDSERKHLFLTGRNGSGKTSVLERLKFFLSMNGSGYQGNNIGWNSLLPTYGKLILRDPPRVDLLKLNNLKQNLHGLAPIGDVLSTLNGDFSRIVFGEHGLIRAYFGSAHLAKFDQPRSIEKVHFDSNCFGPPCNPNFWKYLVTLQAKSDHAFRKGEATESKRIDEWFNYLWHELGNLFGDTDFDVQYDFDTLTFWVVEGGKAKHTLNEFSDGLSAAMNIMSELIMRSVQDGFPDWNRVGIVLIDEIEAHLHIELQKKIMPFLTRLFPNIQFIVTTHSPFVLQSLPNAVICDLETRVVAEDFSRYSSEAIVESYFNLDKYSEALKHEVDEYEALLAKGELSDEEEDRFLDLEEHLATAPRFRAEELVMKLQKIRLKHFDKFKR